MVEAPIDQLRKVYFVMVDRFDNGDPTSDAASTPRIRSSTAETCRVFGTRSTTTSQTWG